MTHVLVDTKNNNNIMLHIQAQTKKEAREKLEKEEKKYFDSMNILKNLGNVGDVQPLAGGLAFYNLVEISPPKEDRVIFDVIDRGYRVFPDSVKRAIEVTEKKFEAMKKSILDEIEEFYDKERKTLSIKIQNKEIEVSNFLSQYVEAKIAFDAGETKYKLDIDEKENLELTEIDLNTIYNKFEDLIALNYSEKADKKELILAADSEDTETLKAKWEQIKQDISQ